MTRRYAGPSNRRRSVVPYPVVRKHLHTIFNTNDMLSLCFCPLPLPLPCTSPLPPPPGLCELLIQVVRTPLRAGVSRVPIRVQQGKTEKGCAKPPGTATGSRLYGGKHLDLRLRNTCTEVCMVRWAYTSRTMNVKWFSWNFFSSIFASRNCNARCVGCPSVILAPSSLC